MQEEIGQSAYAYQLGVESGKTVVVGVNKFGDGAAPPVIPTPDYTQLEAEQRARVGAVKAARDAATAAAALQALERAVREGERQVMPLIIDAVRARASVGEISDALERVWGKYR
jgi:methylmalonyl-CoA mutase N-terminal domain/subunit